MTAGLRARIASTNSATAASSFSAGTTRLTRPHASAVARVDRLAGQQHLHDALARDVAADADGRRGAEDADVDAGQREGRVVGGDGEVAHRDELAAGGRRDAVDARDDGLGEAREREHQAAAVLEEASLPGGVAGVRAHLLEVVAGAEAAALRGEDDDAGVGIGGDLVHARLERREHGRGERVEAVAAVEREADDAVLNFLEDVRRIGGGSGRSGWRSWAERVYRRAGN